MRVRHVRRADIREIARLYYETVHRVNARDYGPEQIQAWAPRVYPDAFWQRRFRRYRVWNPVQVGKILLNPRIIVKYQRENTDDHREDIACQHTQDFEDGNRCGWLNRLRRVVQ